MSRSTSPEKSAKNKANVKRILIVDDHPMVRERLAEVINADPELTVCGEADDRNSALELILKTKPDLALVDLTLKSSHGLDLIKDIRSQHTKVALLVVSMHDESLYAERAIRAGARGFITKQEATHSVVLAIRKVLDGDLYLSESLTRRMLQKIMPALGGAGSPASESLSDRELEVLRLLGHGNTTREIAKVMLLDMSTVETYRSRIKDKLNLHDANQLLKYAIDWVRANDPN